ncbi:MAG: thermonuclease family protein [bacterium]
MKQKIFLFLFLIIIIGCNSNSINMNKKFIKFDDGDTIFYKNISIRILGIDAPEIIHKEHGIFKNQEMGEIAAEFTKNAILKAKTIKYFPSTKDKYNRLLAHILIDDELLAVKLIKAKLAYETISFYGNNGFEKFANQILKASKETSSPTFESPYLWRKKHQKKH